MKHKKKNKDKNRLLHGADRQVSATDFWNYAQIDAKNLFELFLLW